ncbi:MAG: hypothetical protein OHK0052_23160 [Anaerolineales bacterium]
MRSFRWVWLFWWLLAAFAVRLSPAAAKGDAPAPVTLTPRNLLDGYCRYKAILPLAVTLENQGEAVKGQLVVLTHSGVSNLGTAYTAEVTLPTLGRKALMLYPYLPAYADSVTVRLQVRGRVLVEQNLPLACVEAEDWLVGVMSPNGLSDFEGLRDAVPVNGRTFVANVPAEWLPETGLALGALDALLISGVDTASWSPGQRAALKNWVAQGGTLIVTGASFQLTAANLTDVLPIAPQNSLTLRDLRALQMFDSQSVLAEDSPTPIVSGALQPNGEVIAQQNSVALVSRRPLGWGQVFFLGFDPTLAPLRTWGGLTKMYQALFNWRVDAPGWHEGVSQSNYAAEAIRLVNGLQTFGLFLLCGLVGIYLLTAGPLNFLVLRLQKRSELAWLSIPLLAIGFSILTGLVGTQLRGSRPLLQQLTLVQVSADGQARVDSVAGIFSPRRGTQTLLLPENSLAFDLDNTSFGSSDWSLTHLERGENQLTFQMDSAEFRSFVVSSEMAQSPLRSEITLELATQTARLWGSIENTSGLNLQDVTLLAPGSSGLYLGSFDAGEIKTINTVINLNSRASMNPNTVSSSYYYTPSDDTTNLLMGQDPTTMLLEDLDRQRREKFIDAILYDEDYGYKGRGNGVYLSGWVEDDSPLTITTQPIAQNGSQTLYIFEVTPQITPVSNSLTLTPALFLWSHISTAPTSSNSPYDFSLYEGEILTFRFEPLFPRLFAGATVSELVFQLESYNQSGAAGFRAALWNFTTSQWDEIANLQWGSNSITNPQAYVSPAGEIRVQMQTNVVSSYSIDIQSADFSVTLTNLPAGVP